MSLQALGRVFAPAEEWRPLVRCPDL